MGFHVCAYCDGVRDQKHWYPSTSSGDVTLRFVNGNIWEMPDMILHYVADHGYLPPPDFVSDVMDGEIDHASARRTRSMGRPPARRVGYLEGKFATGQTSGPTSFINKLNLLMRMARNDGCYVQTKGPLNAGVSGLRSRGFE
jgi:hypothetical protein